MMRKLATDSNSYRMANTGAIEITQQGPSINVYVPFLEVQSSVYLINETYDLVLNCVDVANKRFTV